MANKKALLVGINYTGTKNELHGCVNDVMTMSEILSSRFGFASNQKRMLTDSSATTKAILERLEWLVEGAASGDVLFFHYSGHGSQVIDSDYDSDFEPDGVDEIICPVDIDWRTKIITDDKLKQIFDRVPPGVNLTVIMDCCHSGSMLDQTSFYQPFGPAAIPVAGKSPNKSRGIPMPADIANRGVGLNLKVKQKSVQSRDMDKTGILISGCQSYQTSADAWIHNKFMGAATYALARELEKYNYSIDYRTLVTNMNEDMKKWGYEQRPELDGNPTLYGLKFLSPIGQGIV